MPVLSESESRAPTIYLLLGCALAILCLFLRQKSKNRIIISGSSSTNTSSSSDEKPQSHQPSPARIPQPQPRSQPLSPLYRDFPLPPPLPPQTHTFKHTSILTPNTDLTHSPTTFTAPPINFPLPTSRSYDSATMPATSEISPSSTTSTSTDPQTSAQVELPRRRSYTKTSAQGTVLEGQIETNESWRRHTRVFGGGVCKACEESEEKRRMSA